MYRHRKQQEHLRRAGFKDWAPDRQQIHSRAPRRRRKQLLRNLDLGMFLLTNVMLSSLGRRN